MNEILLSTLKACRINSHHEGSVFCTHHGVPYRSFRSALARAVCQAGLEDFTFHDLRHTFASRLVMAGVDTPTVQELMGHKDIKMTLRAIRISPLTASSVPLAPW